MYARLRLALLAPVLAAGLAPSAAAEGNDPGSLLLFPVVDSRQGSATFLSITNTNGQVPGGTIRVHLIYVNASNCQKHNAFALLTPFDTLTAISTAHAPSFVEGYAYAYAVSASGTPITFNHLIGSVMVLDGFGSNQYGLNALVFEGMTGHGNPTNVDGDGNRDLDGLEYSKVADKIAIPRFLGQSNKVGGPRSELVMVNLTGGTAFTTSLDFLIFNDNEQAFSGAHTFYCWDRVPLLSISGAFSNEFLKLATDHNPAEIIGMPDQEAGWILIDGGVASSTATSFSDPAFVAVLLELDRLSSASLPFTIGRQTNGTLLPSSIFGD